MADKKECPQCGNDTFQITMEISREKNFEGHLYEGGETEVLHEITEGPEYERVQKVRCSDCYNELGLPTNL